MLSKLFVWIARKRLEIALRKEEKLRSLVAAERKKIAVLEVELERRELEAIVDSYFREVTQ